MDIRRIQPNPRMSRGVVYNGLLFSSGHIDVEGTNVTEQTLNILARLNGLLAEAGSNKSNVLSATIWLADMATFEEMNRVWDAWIDPKNPPARATVEAKLASPGYLVEIAIVAAIEERPPER